MNTEFVKQAATELVKQAINISSQRSGPFRGVPISEGTAPTLVNHPIVQIPEVGQQASSASPTSYATSSTSGQSNYTNHVPRPLTAEEGKLMSGIPHAAVPADKVEQVVESAKNMAGETAKNVAEGTAAEASTGVKPRGKLSKPLMIGAGLLGGLGLGVGGYKMLNKEAAMANLLEQGYSVEAAVSMVKQAEESEQFKNLIRAQKINDAAEYRGAAEGMGLGLGLGTLGAGIGHLASKGKINRGDYIAGGAMLGYIPGALAGTIHGRAAARENALNKEAAMANLLEQGYSVEAALSMLG